MGILAGIHRQIGLLHLYWEETRLMGAAQANKLARAWKTRTSPVELTLPGVPAPLWVGPDDGFLLVEIFRWHIYDAGLAGPVRLILDLGANIGLASVYFAMKYPQATIVAVEPDDANCRLFRQNTAPFANVRLIQGGVWHREARLVCRNPEAEKFSLQFEESGEASAGLSAYPVPHFVREGGGGPIDILKMDVEGAEVRILSGDCSAWLPLARVVFVEAHGPEAEKTVESSLRRHGLALARSHHWRWSSGTERMFTYRAPARAGAAT